MGNTIITNNVGVIATLTALSVNKKKKCKWRDNDNGLEIKTPDILSKPICGPDNRQRDDLEAWKLALSTLPFSPIPPPFDYQGLRDMVREHFSRTGTLDEILRDNNSSNTWDGLNLCIIPEYKDEE